MDKFEKHEPCSPYLQRPLRSLDQALKDQADDNHLKLVRAGEDIDLSPLVAALRK
ncbi:MAG: hypothetical protein HOK30_02940 [Rhodospirillaceae bacterium]|jgi:hypothetical protein|nr:hypothetical protein [Rhodospirillaceae bacterium]MBT5192953.1 hypothetical protein [Rhodospirillaceae bacterium]MBT5897066.1 hypothetical protein [Rhodospirillaceae bacterium]MBT6426593.1 hypothetical protein [Rhodospirillaceae bacterium]MBT7758349.1 hypothetical protein [Rhodospirillaceae bacterium]